MQSKFLNTTLDTSFQNFMSYLLTRLSRTSFCKHWKYTLLPTVLSAGPFLCLASKNMCIEGTSNWKLEGAFTFVLVLAVIRKCSNIFWCGTLETFSMGKIIRNPHMFFSCYRRFTGFDVIIDDQAYCCLDMNPMCLLRFIPVNIHKVLPKIINLQKEIRLQIVTMSPILLFIQSFEIQLLLAGSQSIQASSLRR